MGREPLRRPPRAHEPEIGKIERESGSIVPLDVEPAEATELGHGRELSTIRRMSPMGRKRSLALGRQADIERGATERTSAMSEMGGKQLSDSG